MDENNAIDRILTSIKLINGRKYLSVREQRAVRKAIFLAQQPARPAELSRTATDRTAPEKREENYRIFLNELSGNSLLIAVCAVTFGQTTIGNMRDDLRIMLPSRIKERQHDFHCDVLVAFCDNEYKLKAESIKTIDDEPSQLSRTPDQGPELSAGQAVPLDRLDVINMLTSEHFKGAFMHEPFDTELSPVVYLNISYECSHWLRNKMKPKSF